MDANTPRGGERLAVMQDVLGAMPRYDSSERVAGLRSVLARPQFTELEADYTQQKKKNPRRQPEWFSLLGGPRNRRQLARLLNHEAEYFALYGEWSDIVHGTDASLYMTTGSHPRQPAFIALRSAYAMPQRAFMAAAFMLRGTRLMLQHFRPNEPGLSRWYIREIKGPFDRLRRLKVNVE